MLGTRICVAMRWLCGLSWIAYGLSVSFTVQRLDAQDSPAQSTVQLVRPPAPPKHSGLEFVARYCLDCHTGNEAEAGLDLSHFDNVAAMAGSRKRWSEILRRVRDGEMPPRDADVPLVAERRQFLAWVPHEFRTLVSTSGIRPGDARLRRMNGTEYAATMRDLLGIPINAAQGLPADGSGGEGFDNASETLFISALHAEKYRDAAREALNYALANRDLEPKSRGAGASKFLALEPTDDRDALATARQALGQFLPLAFRRPVLDAEIDDYLTLFSQGYAQSDSYVEGLRLALEAALVSPKFLFLMEEPNTATEPVQVSQYELASRLSYFLWASMPDEHQAAGTPATLRAKLERHRRDPNCAGCHNRMDPLGFGLENFDVLGRWRTEQAGQPIDARGQLSDGTIFNGPEELRRVLLQRKDDFARNLTEKMLGYALGRGLINDDYITVDHIVEELKRNQYSSQTLLRGIIHSVPFQYKAGTDPQATVTMSFENHP